MIAIDFEKQHNYNLMTLILCWTGMVVMSSLYVSIPLITMFSDNFHVSLSQAAKTSSIFSIGFASGCFIYGAISEKYGRKNIICIGLISLSVISLLLGMVHSFSYIVVLRGLQGLAAATFSPVALAYTLEVFPNERKVGAVGFISTGFLVAGIVGQVFSAYVSQQFHWQFVFYSLSAVYILTASIVFWLLPTSISHNQKKNIWEPMKQLGIVFTNKNLIFSYVIAFVLLMSFVSMYTTLGQYLTNLPFQMNNHELLYIRSFGVLGMILSPLAGKLAKRFSVLFVLRWALLLSIFALASMGFLTNIFFLTVMSIVFVSGIALSVPSLVSLVGQLGGKARSIAISMYTVILFTGTSFGPIISFTFMKAFSFTTTFILLAAILGLGLLAACFVKHENLPMAEVK
ncbi:MFS transporter [Bacillus sp. S10(2024)]|uniref:MFS transporter n=1 Tax=Bacillus sp. S10(2024) TaxID=3162886 RepID=UPI003D23ECFE